MTLKLFLVAGEPSGDSLGATLMSAISKSAGDVQFEGVGGPEMEAAGLKSIFDYSELSVMGIAEVIPKLPGLLRRLRETASSACRSDPAAMVTIDSPDFCLRVAKRVKAKGAGFPIVHYVSPSVWAWRPGRAASLSKAVDHILSILPFEPDLLRGMGIESTFVGHPAVARPVLSPQDLDVVRSRLKISDGEPLLCVLPGSRNSEVSLLEPVFRKAAFQFLQHQPQYRLVVPAAPAVAMRLRAKMDDWPPGTILLDPATMSRGDADLEKLAVMQLADIALAASGTVVLELAVARTPMVAAYDLNWVSRQIVGSMLRVDTVNLVNLVTGTRVVPEFLGKNCRADLLCESLLKLADDAGERKRQLQCFADTLDRLGSGGKEPGEQAADAVLNIIRQSRQVRRQRSQPGHSG